MLKGCKYTPEPETNRLILRQQGPDDAEDPGKWPGREEFQPMGGEYDAGRAV